MKIYAVIVTYFPRDGQVDDLLHELKAADCHVVIVDNTPCAGREFKFDESNKVSVFLQGENKGVAIGQNIGIRYALDNAADAVVLFDQDSYMTAAHINDLALILAGGAKIVAPVVVDEDSGEEIPSFCLNKFGLPQKKFSKNENSPYPVNLVIASGCMITASVFHKIGLMDEDLFIDQVDFEWCFRCYRSGEIVYINPAVIIKHKIGNGDVNVFFMRVLIHSEIRVYYSVRNNLILLKKKIPIFYAIKNWLAAMITAVVLSIYKRKISYVVYGLLGCVDGVFYKKNKIAKIGRFN